MDADLGTALGALNLRRLDLENVEVSEDGLRAISQGWPLEELLLSFCYEV